MTCPKAVRTRTVAYLFLVNYLSQLSPRQPQKSISTDSQQVFARGGEREVDLGLDCRLNIAANLGHGNKIEQFFLLVVIMDGDGMIATMKFLALPKKLLLFPSQQNPVWG